MSDYLRDLIRRGAGLPLEDEARPSEMPEPMPGDQGLEELVEQADPATALPAETEPMPAVSAPLQPTVSAMPAVLAVPVEPVAFEARLRGPDEPREHATEPASAPSETAAAADQPREPIVAAAPASTAATPPVSPPAPDAVIQPSALLPVQLTLHALPMPPVVEADPEAGAVAGDTAPPTPALQAEAGPVRQEPAPGATRPVMGTLPPVPAEDVAPPTADPEVAVHIGRLEVLLAPPPAPQPPVLPPARPDWRRGFPEHPPAERYRRARWH